MIYNIIVWTILTVVCLICGNGILNYFNIDFLRVGDRFILSIWLGIIAFIIIFLGLSFIVPLSTTTGVITFLFAILITLLIPKNRQNLWSIYNFIELKKILFYYLLSITLAIIINKPIKWFDTGLYHWHSIKWLSNFGTVTGLALINSKHGFNAGWFAFSAPLHLPLLDSHVSGVSNGFIFLIAIIHFCLSSQYLLTAQNQISDWFITIYNLLVCSTYIATIFTDSPILISYSPDVFVNILIGFIAWVTLTISQQQKEVYPISYRAIIPLFLALGTVTAKLTALPLLMITFLFVIYNSSQKVKSIFFCLILCLMTLLPMFGYSFKTTGCLLYPSSFACLNVPWSINSETIIKEKEEILGIKKKDSQGNYWLYALHKRWKWLKASAKFKTIMFLLITSFIFAIVIIKQNQKNQNFQGFLWIIMLGITGMLFILLQIPLLRFGIGYFISISTLFLSILLQENYLIINRILRGKENICYFISIILLSAIMVKNFNGKNILIPPLMPKVELIQAQKNDLQYVYPRNWTVKCWNAPLPCSPTLIKGNVSLKDSQKGLKGGFVRDEG